MATGLDSKLRVAVVGATGVVGRELLSALAERNHPSSNVVALASERSEGQELEYGDDSLEVEKLTPEAFRGIQLALFAAPPEVAREHAPRAQAAGAWVVDVSPAYRFEPQVPLVHPLVNVDALDRPFPGRIVATPSATGAALFALVAPLHRRFGVTRVGVTALLGVSSAGMRGVTELERQTADLLSGRELEPSVFPHRIAFNVIPAVGAYDAPHNAFAEEVGWTREALRLLPEPHPPVFGTAIQVPTFYGHALSLTVALGATPTEGELRDVLRAAPSVKVLDQPAERIYPMPMLITADPSIHVGRIRAVPGAPGGFSLFATVDNAGRGAALQALEVAERLVLGRAARA